MRGGWRLEREAERGWFG
jgi:hypothetical protein